MSEKGSCVARGFSPCLTTGSNESNRCLTKKIQTEAKNARLILACFGSRTLKDKGS